MKLFVLLFSYILFYLSFLKAMMELTNQEKGELVSKTNILLKPELKKKTSFPRIISQTFDKPIFNQSPLTQNPLLKLFLPKRCFL